MSVTFSIRESKEGDKIFYEVWRRNHEHCTECLLAEADTRAEARELLRHYASQDATMHAAIGCTVEHRGRA